jgi:hypothetical protein
MITRRNLLMGAGLAAGTGLVARSARAGVPDDPSFALGLPGGREPYKILEIFLYGGLSPWESFVFEPTDIAGVYDPAHRTAYDAAEVVSSVDRCPAVSLSGLPARIVRGPADRHFRFESSPGTPSRPFGFARGTRPLVARPEVLKRTRIVTMKSDFDAHPLGMPQAVTGRRIGDARAASIGAAVQRRHASDGPVSFVIMPPSNRFFSVADYRIFDAFLATGRYRGAPRPVRLSLDGDNELAAWAARTSSTTQKDALLRHYRDAYVARVGGLSRSGEVAAYSAAVDGLGWATSLIDTYGLLPSSSGPSLSHCTALPAGFDATGPHWTRTSLQLARSLFARGARYVSMIDTGFGRDTGAPYDGHNETARMTTGNLYNLLSELMAVVNAPGEAYSGRIELADTLIVLNTEFGRTLALQNSFGRNHYGKAYVTALIGGPVAASADGAPVLRGAFSGMGDTLTGTYAPWKLTSNVLRAAGVWDEHPDNFAAPEIDSTILPELPLRPRT